MSWENDRYQEQLNINRGVPTLGPLSEGARSAQLAQQLADSQPTYGTSAGQNWQIPTSGPTYGTGRRGRSSARQPRSLGEQLFALAMLGIIITIAVFGETLLNLGIMLAWASLLFMPALVGTWRARPHDTYAAMGRGFVWRTMRTVLALASLAVALAGGLFGVIALGYLRLLLPTGIEPMTGFVFGAIAALSCLVAYFGGWALWASSLWTRKGHGLGLLAVVLVIAGSFIAPETDLYDIGKIISNDLGL